MDPIKFHFVGDDYGWLSNSAPYPIFLESKMWYTAEHYFQTQKFYDETVQKEILRTRSAAEVIRIAGNPKLRVRRDWDKLKVGFMLTAVRTKFTQIPDLKKLLLNTGDGFADISEAAGLGDVGSIACAVADYDNDGRPDLALSTSTGLRLLNPGSPTDRRRQPFCTYMTATVSDSTLSAVTLHRV